MATDGQKTEEKYAVTVIDIVNVEPDVSTMATGSEDGDPTWDGSYNVKAYSTIYYSYEHDDAGNKYYKMTRGTGGWSVSDPSVSLSGRNVELAQMGTNRTGIFATYRMPKQYLSTNSFSYYTSSNWEYIMLGFGGGALAVDTNVTLKRGTSPTWELDHQQRYTP